MAKFREMRSFIEVVEAGSFVGGAESMGLSKQVVSRHVAELEQHLGVRLLNRTTRRLSLTDDGQAYFARARELLEQLEELDAQVASGSAEPSGLIRINAPFSFGVLHLSHLWGRFADRYPKVSLDVILSDRVVDLVEEGYDLAVRISELQSSTLVSRKLTSTRMVLCASPGYIEKYGVPLMPDDLRGHRMISYSYLSTGDEWRFIGPSGMPVHVRMRTRLHTNSGDTCRAAALDDQGIVLQPEFMVGADLQQGRLVELMPRYNAGELGIYAVYPSRRHLPVKTRCLIDYLISEFSSPDWELPDRSRNKA